MAESGTRRVNRGGFYLDGKRYCHPSLVHFNGEVVKYKWNGHLLEVYHGDEYICCPNLYKSLSDADRVMEADARVEELEALIDCLCGRWQNLKSMGRTDAGGLQQILLDAESIAAKCHAIFISGQLSPLSREASAGMPADVAGAVADMEDTKCISATG